MLTWLLKILRSFRLGAERKAIRFRPRRSKRC